MNIYQNRLGMAVALAFCLGARLVYAAPLTLDNVTAPEAAARLSGKFGITVSLQGHYSQYTTISFAVEDADAPAGRLQAINALANALGADFNKEFVIQKTPDGPASVPHIDTTATMPFPRTTYSAKAAITMVAGLDDATAQSKEDAYGFLIVTGPSTIPLDLVIANDKAVDVSGTITLSSPTLSVAQAAAEIAAQTHTHWQTVYVLTPRVPARAPGGTVIGRTGGGSAIVELASVYYHDAKWQARQQQIAAAAQQQAQVDQQALADQQAAYQQAIQQGTLDVNGNANAAGGYNSSQYNSYGSNYGYGYGNAPIVFGPGNY